MSEIMISAYPDLQGGKATSEDYSVASTFGDIDLVVFNKIPKRQYGMIESWIEEILEHEALHILMCQLGEQKASHGFDNFFPHLSALWSFQRNPVRFIKQRSKVKK